MIVDSITHRCNEEKLYGTANAGHIVNVHCIKDVYKMMYCCSHVIALVHMCLVLDQSVFTYN